MSNIPDDYAEHMISGRLSGFRFQPRAGSLKMRAISNANIKGIIRSNDHAALAELLNNTNIINADVADEDFDFHSSDFLVKLFKICQLSLEFSHATNTMLKDELNEINRVSKINGKNLRRQDEVVASLRDELYHCKEALKKAEEQQSSGVSRLDYSKFPSQQRRRVNSNSSTSASESDEEDDSEQSFTNDATQKVPSTGTLKDHQIMNDSALVILPSSSNTMESKLDDIKSMLERQAAVQESITDLLVKEMSKCNEILDKVLRTDNVDRIDDVITTPSDVRSPSLEVNNDEPKERLVHPWRQEDKEQAEKPELKVDTMEEWPFGLNFDTYAGPPEEINVAKNASDGGSPSNETNERTVETTSQLNSPAKAVCCDCVDESEVCDECINATSPLSSEAVIAVAKNNDEEGHFTFSEFDKTTKFTSADYDYSCDKSDFESLQIGAKEANAVTDTDLQSIEMSLEEYSLGLGANEVKQKKKSRILKNLTFKPKWKKFMRKKPVDL